ncbi:DUF2188 domain-containing protein [Saccharopolyspora erythraea]|uniref:DUF2188 domain-containing protein n=1 Tax=Saccharopolyspora erythraea TaxID=1836 RepID=UPI001BA685CB|nr:DUF2188 domain-containing protein [Saccharopolyspora erythraea]QUH00662.1 DUF2188 domain-containing protein [Saccharopolyspora erythraea]
MGVWRVRQHPEGRWQVLTPGDTQACKRMESQADAVAAAYRFAADEGGGAVIVHASGGEVEWRRIVPPTAEPYRWEWGSVETSG